MADKVLICDDEVCINEVLKLVIQREGYEVISAYDGIEALNLAFSEVPDAIILDLNMPGKTGYEVCKCLRGDMVTKDIFIIVLTGNWMELDKSWGIDSKPDYIFTKPVAPGMLSQKLHELLDH